MEKQMEKQYLITETVRKELINVLDRLAGTRPITNWLEFELIKNEHISENITEEVKAE